MEGKTIISGRREPPTRAEGPVAPWSRRRLLTEGVLPLAFALTLPPAFGRETESPPRVQGLPAGGAAPASPPAGGSGAVRSAIDWTGRFTTAVRVNHQGPYGFLVDTGAERTVIAEELAERLALPHSRQVLVQGIVRREAASLVAIRELQIGSLVSSLLEVPTLPGVELGVPGYLGLDVLDGRRVIFDFTAGTLTVTKPQGFFAALFANDDVRVPTLGESGRLRATDCLIDGVRAAAFIDTGAQISVINGALHAALQRRNPRQTVLDSQVLTGVTGGTVAGATVVLDMIRLGDLVLTFTQAVVADLPVFALWGLIQQPALLIGVDCLRRCGRVSIDYRRKELRFKIARVLAATPPEAESGPPPRAG